MSTAHGSTLSWSGIDDIGRELGLAPFRLSFLCQSSGHTHPPPPPHESFPKSTAQATRDWGKQDLIHIHLSLSLERSTQHLFDFTYVFFTLLVQVLKSPNVLSLPLSLSSQNLFLFCPQLPLLWDLRQMLFSMILSLIHFLSVCSHPASVLPTSSS